MAASRGDATSVPSLETMENLTDVEEIKKAFENLCKDEVKNKICISSFTSRTEDIAVM